MEWSMTAVVFVFHQPVSLPFGPLYQFPPMSLDFTHLRSQIESAAEGSISRSDLVRLVQLARTLCQAHFEYMRGSVARLMIQLGLTTTDLAYDCIAEVFTRDEQSKFPLIENLVGSLRDNLENLPDREVFLAFKAFLLRVADAQLARLYAQADPVGSKIHRNIRDCLKTSPTLELGRDFRGYVVRPRQNDSLDHLEQFPCEELEREFLSNTQQGQRVPQLLQILNEALACQSKYRRSVSLTEVVQLFRKIYVEDAADNAESQELAMLEGLTQFEVDHMRAQVENVLKEKILLSYVAKGKADGMQAEGMFFAMHDLLADWCSGEDQTPGLFEYLQRHISVNKQTYEDTFRVRMEYLLRIARSEFAARLTKQL